MTPSAVDRLFRHAEEDADGCWLWGGRLDHGGYGHFKEATRHTVRAHRAAWVALRGDIPTGLMVDHLCRVRRCINPWHMDLVTNRVNTQRGEAGRPRQATGMQRCGTHRRDDGYERTLSTGQIRWVCRTCAKARKDRWKARQPVA